MSRHTFTLKQHTPIIHFLPDQPGATLRATELKPKLDQFLIKHAFQDNFDLYKTNLIGWKQGKQEKDFENKKAFDYKVSIESPNNKVIKIEKKIEGKKKSKQFPLFFGNLGEEKDNKSTTQKQFVFTESPIEVEIFSFNIPLLAKIKSCFPQFLFETNFGTRQSKGFGSFYLADLAPDHAISKIRFRFSVETESSNKTKRDGDPIYDRFFKLFSEIDLLYKTLRGGINHGIYFKSMMFKYAKKYHFQWDKKSIKEAFFIKDLKNQKIIHPSSDVLAFSSRNMDTPQTLWRDLLGLSTEEEWKSYNEAKVTKENANIERFKSPITFKVIKRIGTVGLYDIFLHLAPIHPGFLKQIFTIKVNGFPDELELITPSGFDLNHFLTFAFNEDLDAHVADERHRENRQFENIKRIYDEIKRNLEANHG